MKKTVGLLAVAVIATIVAYAVICRADDKGDEKLPCGSAEKDKSSVLTIALAETSASRDASTVSASKKPPYKVALIVQNHTSDAPTLPMAAFADTLTARLSGKMLRIVNPHNVIGVNQNRTARGEEMPEASALNLIVHDPDLAGVITAAIQEFTGRDIRHESKVIGHTLRVRLAISLMDATGGTVCGIDGFEDSRNCRPEDVKSDTATLYEELMHQAAAKAAAKLLAKLQESEWKPVAADIAHVNFTCNIQGADVKIDGVAFGTVPAMVEVSKGVHNLLVEYPFCVPYATKAYFTDGQTYNIVLQLDATGRERFKSEALFAETLERIRKTGATDDYVRRTLADGTSQFWKNSGVKIDTGEVKDLKLAPPGGGESVAPKSPTVDQLMEKAREL